MLTDRLYHASSIVLILAAVSIFGPSQSRAQIDKFKDPQSIAEGARLFAPTCGTGYCHGSGGTGGGAPKLRGRSFEPDYLFKTISEGIAGTPMIPFNSQYSEEQIWKLVAYIMSDAPASFDAGAAEVRPTNTAAAREAGTSASTLIGDAKAGRSLFFDSSAKYNCSQCHSFGGEGSAAGPDLSKSGKGKSARELFVSIAVPQPPADTRYQTLVVTLKSGEKITGLQKDEDSESMRVYDMIGLPPVLRTIQKTDVAKTERLPQSVMPKTYAERYTIKQLLDIVAFLKSVEGKQPVSLEDVLIGK